MAENTGKKKHKRISRGKVIGIVVMLISLCLVSLIVEFILLRYTSFLSGDARRLAGTWTTELETTDMITGEVMVWLSTVQGEEIDVEDVRSRFETCDIECVLSFDKDTHTYMREVSEDDYKLCHDEAYQALATILKELTVARIEASGIELSELGMSIDDFIVETIGCTTEEYLVDVGPEIMPTFENLQQNINSEGTYSLEKGILKLGDSSCEYMVDADTLLITDGNESKVYSKK